MFDGIQDQFHQFLASSSSSSSRASATNALPLIPLTFSLYGSSTTTTTPTYPSSFDNINIPFAPPPPPPPPPPHHHHHHHHQQALALHRIHEPAAGGGGGGGGGLLLQQHKDHHEDKEQSGLLSTGLVMMQQHLPAADHREKGRLLSGESIDPWSNEEALALLRIRSNMDNSWFPDFTWDHVSRKLGELGFKRSAENCKEKFEEESRYLNGNIRSCSSKNNYTLFGELEDLYDHSDHHHDHHHRQQQDRDQPANSSHHHHKYHDSKQGNIIDHDHVQTSCKELEEEEEEDKNINVEDDHSRRDKLVEEGDHHQSVDSDHEQLVVEQEDEEEEEEEEEENKRSSAVVILRKRKRSVHSQRKRRRRKFEMLKGFCESIMNKMMAHQQELHNKILENLVKRDEEKMTREEAWKKHEMERIKKEMEYRAHEQALACDRQAKILELLNKFTSISSSTHTTTTTFEPYNNQTLSQIICLDPGDDQKTIHEDIADHDHVINAKAAPKPSTSSTPPTPTSSNTAIVVQTNQNNSPSLPTSSNDDNQASPNPSNSIIPYPMITNHPANSPNGKSTPRFVLNDQEAAGDHQDMMMKSRWPRDEVLALINIRCSLYNINNITCRDDHQNNNPPKDQGGNSITTNSSTNTSTASNSKGPLWERISKGMLELGYKRSAKRCKEKWENINKYFRKTKDMNKKRSLDSRTCPYFHQLSYLYSTQGTIVVTPMESTLSDNQAKASTANIIIGDDHAPHQGGHEDDHNLAQVPSSCGFEY
ncbi:hypothetical protein Dimus_021792 [Dionaea muscipula]